MPKPLPIAKGPRFGTMLGFLLLLFWCSNPSLANSSNEFQNDVVVRGRIIDNTGAGMPGVNVLVKGSSFGTTTDADGQYTLSIPSSSSSNATLVYSFIGYQPQEVIVGSR